MKRATSIRLARYGMVAPLAVVALGVVALAGTAQAQRESAVTGTKLVQICSSKDKTALEACEAYIEGVSDSVTVYQGLRPRDASRGQPFSANAYICIPASTTGVQLREGWLTWAKQHQGDMGRHATSLVLRAMRDTHPCPGAPASGGGASDGGGAPKR